VQHLLENGPVDSALETLRSENHRLRGQVEDLRSSLHEEKTRARAAEAILENTKNALRPLYKFYKGLGEIFGEIDISAMNFESSSAPSNGPLNADRYQPWKDKFPGQTASAIDILAKYEAGLTRKQLAGFLKVEPGSGTMSQIIFKLNKAELIHKDGNTIRLKRI
jgi:hypothetical protein